jgi:putative phosphoribosyl transferase
MNQMAHRSSEVAIQANHVTLQGNLAIPEGAAAIVLFVHGSGSSRNSPRNRFVAEELNKAGLATVLFDLLTAEEERIDMRTRELRFDIPLLAQRLTGAIDWVRRQEATKQVNVGLFGASTGAAAALIAAAHKPEAVSAIVSRGGRPDLAGLFLPRVQAPTLLIVGGDDDVVIGLNQQAARQLRAPHQVRIVPGATHLFEEPGKLEEVARLARDWFCQYL